MTDLQQNAKAVIALNGRMHADLVEFLKEHNGFIRTDNYERRTLEKDECDTMYAIISNGEEMENKEYPILAVALFGEDQVGILPDLTYGDTTILGMTDQEVLDSENWERIRGGNVLQNATLYNLCECLDEYVD